MQLVLDTREVIHLKLIEEPIFKTEKITSIDNVEGFTGIITGIKEVTTSGQLGIKFFIRTENWYVADNLQVGYPIMITGTTVELDNLSRYS